MKNLPSLSPPFVPAPVPVTQLLPPTQSPNSDNHLVSLPSPPFWQFPLWSQIHPILPGRPRRDIPPRLPSLAHPCPPTPTTKLDPPPGPGYYACDPDGLPRDKTILPSPYQTCARISSSNLHLFLFQPRHHSEARTRFCHRPTNSIKSPSHSLSSLFFNLYTTLTTTHTTTRPLFTLHRRDHRWKQISCFQHLPLVAKSRFSHLSRQPAQKSTVNDTVDQQLRITSLQLSTNPFRFKTVRQPLIDSRYQTSLSPWLAHISCCSAAAPLDSTTRP